LLEIDGQIAHWDGTAAFDCCPSFQMEIGAGVRCCPPGYRTVQHPITRDKLVGGIGSGTMFRALGAKENFAASLVKLSLKLLA